MQDSQDGQSHGGERSCPNDPEPTALDKRGGVARYVKTERELIIIDCALLSFHRPAVAVDIRDVGNIV